MSGYVAAATVLRQSTGHLEVLRHRDRCWWESQSGLAGECATERLTLTVRCRSAAGLWRVQTRITTRTMHKPDRTNSPPLPPRALASRRMSDRWRSHAENVPLGCEQTPCVGG